jgi:hypothetical protein
MLICLVLHSIECVAWKILTKQAGVRHALTQLSVCILMLPCRPGPPTSASKDPPGWGVVGGGVCVCKMEARDGAVEGLITYYW